MVYGAVNDTYVSVAVGNGVLFEVYLVGHHTNRAVMERIFCVKGGDFHRSVGQKPP